MPRVTSTTRTRGRRLSPLAIMVLVLAVAAVCALSAAQVVMRGCVLWSCPPPRSFSIVDLAIPREMFPVSSLVGGMIQTSETGGARELASQDVFWDAGRGSAHFVIWRYGTEGKASRAFGRSVETDRGFGLLECAGVELSPTSADVQYIGCGEHNEFGGFRASANMRYAEYVVSLVAEIDDRMSFDSFGRLIAYVNREMAGKLGEPATEAP